MSAGIGKINEIAKKISDLETQYSRLGWVQYTAGYDFGIEEAYKKLMDVYMSKSNYDAICDCLDKDLDTKDKRRMEIMYKAFKPYHLSQELNELDFEIQKKTNELSKILNTYRVVFENREISSVELTQILFNEENRERRKAAFMARCQVNKPLVDGGFVELVKMRKEYARLYGAKDFVALKLEMDELDPSIFDGWVPDLHKMLPKIKSVRSKYAREFLNSDNIMPWDEVYINSRIAPSLNSSVDMSEYYKNISDIFKMFGFAISKYNITYDIFPRANKSEWGYNFPIETAKDSRILANVKNKYNEYNVLLHETGHAVHSFCMYPEETMLNMGVSGIISEGIANLFGSFIYDRVFYQKFFNDLEEVDREFSSFREYRKATSLLSIHGILSDHELYKNKVESLDDIYDVYWKSYKDILKEEPYAEEAPWGYVIHYTTHPIYRHNYFMGDVTCEMLSKVFCKKYGVDSIMKKPLEFGDFLLNDVMKASGMYKYQELFRRISGEEFSLKYMME